MPQATLTTCITTIILTSLINKSDARLKGNRETHGSSGRTVIFSNQNTTRYTNAIITSRVGSLTFNSESNCDLDNHADTCVLGKYAHIFMDHERSVNIVGYDKSNGTLANNMKTVSGVLSYDNPTSGTTVIIWYIRQSMSQQWTAT